MLGDIDANALVLIQSAPHEEPKKNQLPVVCHTLARKRVLDAEEASISWLTSYGWFSAFAACHECLCDRRCSIECYYGQFHRYG